MKSTTAQVLYDTREEFGDIDGNDLHTLFRFLCDGEPSPAGRTPISEPKLLDALHAEFGDRSMHDFLSRVLDDMH